ncbi:MULTISPECIES: ComEA family DNA-binding protein [Serratia]|jgi:competence protein ComEA|uniref:Helix-hairpin-helix domain-containing protein n=1 Tax=Serratia surfactantfaciens TaxID=2741499 RepID=A0ABS0LTY6_9GAMM|nr:MULTISPECIES: helix-hairpin-helix domain-containing protein [Serratia]WMW62409.1 helix-hairpin-helix domain-containing protein [Serratia marcescens]AOE98082.1 competence protein ComEA [Serratia surfactantfaciens]MBH1918785.1 helix-hairpin-helix domain-containing protein [Serratia surfactantfaciens]MBI6152312.1 helix-hairpin-helix domain-containing protein [Serratia surfactantfaciens]MTD08893.1 competence protein ComEA [Serratia sp. YC16]
MQPTEKKTLSGYRHHVAAALTALLLCLAAGPAAAAEKAEAPAPMLSAPASNGGQPAITKAAEEAAVSINQATAEQLAAALSGVGLKKAEGIVRYREQNGPFTQVEQLQEVPGIGPALFEKNRTRLKM